MSRFIMGHRWLVGRHGVCVHTREMGVPLCSLCWILMLFDGSALLSLTHTHTLFIITALVCWVSLVTCSHNSFVLVQAGCLPLLSPCFLFVYLFVILQGNARAIAPPSSAHPHSTCTFCINWNQKKRSGIGACISCVFVTPFALFHKQRQRNNNNLFPFTLIRYHNPSLPSPAFPSSISSLRPEPQIQILGNLLLLIRTLCGLLSFPLFSHATTFSPKTVASDWCLTIFFVWISRIYQRKGKVVMRDSEERERENVDE